MAKTQWKPRRVRSEDERGTGSSDYITLDEGEKFLGYALFAGDPAKDEKGYYEFLQHWNTAARRSVPCAGDDCPFCEDGDKPKDVANTLWLVIKDEKGNALGKDGEGELRIFKANSIVIKQLTEMRSEDEAIMGVQFRVTRMDDRGNYMLQPKAKKLKASEVKELLKSKDAPDFDAMVTNQLRKMMEGIAVARAMDDDDDDGDDEPKREKSKKGSGKSDKSSKKSKKGAWPDSLDEEMVTVVSVDDDGNFIEVSHEDYKGTKNVYTNDDIVFDLTDLSEDDEVTVTTGDVDDDGDYILTDEPVLTGSEDEDEDDDDEEESDSSDDEDGEESDLPDKIEDAEFVVQSIDATESTIDVVSADDDDLKFTLYFLDKGPASEVDFDDYEEGTKIVVSAEKDSVGDMIATEVPSVVEEKKSKKKGGKKSSAAKKKGGKKK